MKTGTCLGHCRLPSQIDGLLFEEAHSAGTSPLGFFLSTSTSSLPSLLCQLGIAQVETKLQSKPRMQCILRRIAWGACQRRGEGKEGTGVANVSVPSHVVEPAEKKGLPAVSSTKNGEFKSGRLSIQTSTVEHSSSARFSSRPMGLVLIFAEEASERKRGERK